MTYNDDFSGHKRIDEQDELTAHILNMQTDFAALDAAEIQALAIVTIIENDEGEVEVHAQLGGNPLDRIRIVNALMALLAKQAERFASGEDNDGTE